MPSMFGTRGIWLVPVIALGVMALAGAAAYLALDRSESPRQTAAAFVEPPSRTAAPAPPPRPESEQPSVSMPKTLLSEKGSKEELPREEVSAAVERKKPAEAKAGAPSETVGSAALAKELLSALAELDLSGGTLSEEQADDLDEQLKQLAEQGGEAIPAISEFLAGKQDLKFDGLKGKEFVKFPSLRAALIDTLKEIGGPEAVELSAQTLQNTTEPMEIALLTRTLEQLAPREYRDKAIAVARDTLAKATSGDLDARTISPLFEVLQKYGDASVAADLEKAVPKWNYYATLALAGLPDGAGIPSLIRLAQDPAVSAMGNGDYALRALAQVAMKNPDARDALMEQARLNQIPEAAWPTVASTMAGNYIQYGNQIFGSTAASVTWSEEQIQKRVALIDQIMAVTANQTAKQQLYEARSSLLARLNK